MIFKKKIIKMIDDMVYLSFFEIVKDFNKICAIYF